MNPSTERSALGVVPNLSPRSLGAELERPSLVNAKCRGRTELFFGRAGERPEARQRREATARLYCERCPVLEACRTWARLNGESGFWGGESEEERAKDGFPPTTVTRRSVSAFATRARSSETPDETPRRRAG